MIFKTWLTILIIASLNVSTCVPVLFQDLPSCWTRCGKGIDRNAPCQCNSQCDQFNDCCSDYTRMCAPGTTCSGRCDSAVNSSLTCQCNAHCERFSDCCPDYTQVCKSTTNRVSPTTTTPSPIVLPCLSLQEVTNQLWINDVNHFTYKELMVSYQAKVDDILDHKNATDASKNKLFSFVNNTKLNTGTYALFRKLRDNYDPRKGRLETLTNQEASEQTAFLNAIVDTKVMDILLTYARCKGWVQTKNELKQKLMTTWLSTYSRTGQGRSADSSGFEHLMLGEYKYTPDPLVNGYHNWISFYEDEKSGDVNYYGWVSKVESVGLVGAAFQWHHFYKAKGAFLIGVSPEFDLALYSVCFWTVPDQPCTFRLGGKELKMQTYSTGTGDHLATAFIH